LASEVHTHKARRVQRRKKEPPGIAESEAERTVDERSVRVRFSEAYYSKKSLEQDSQDLREGVTLKC
jgi:hypothetical protein